MADGKIYGLPHINDCYHCSMSQKMWLYQPWMDALGLETPTTTEEFYQVLKAFKEQDPNGNGKADEIPLSGTQRTNGGWHAQLDQFLMNSFIYNDGVTNANSTSLMLEDGTVKAAFTEPGWKEGLIYLNKLYSEGLIDPQVFTNDSNQIRQLGENPDTPILGATGAGWYGVFTQNGGPSGRWEEFTPIAPLEGPSGLRQTPQTPYQPTGGQANFVITNVAQNPAAAFRLADVFYGFDATTRSVFGPEGEDWVRAGEDDVSISGGDAEYTVLKVWSGEEHNRHWNQAAPTFRTNEYRLAQTYNPDDPLERWLYEWTRDLMEPYGVTDKAVPPMAFTEEQSKLFGELNTTVYNVVDEWFANCVIGNYDIEEDWDTYIETLNDSGLEDFLAIYQEAYDAKYRVSIDSESERKRLCRFARFSLPRPIPHSSTEPNMSTTIQPQPDQASRLDWWRAAASASSFTGDPSAWSARKSVGRRGGERRGFDRGGSGDVPVEAYDNLYKEFNPIGFDAAEWVQIAQDAGTRYMVFTSKHHDGFVNFDTALTDYKITSPDSPLAAILSVNFPTCACCRSALWLLLFTAGLASPGLPQRKPPALHRLFPCPGD